MTWLAVLTRWTYKARLILGLNIHRQPILGDNVHTINVHADGRVTEPHYRSLVFDSVHSFNPEREWDPRLLSSYHIEKVN